MSEESKDKPISESPGNAEEPAPDATFAGDAVTDEAAADEVVADESGAAGGQEPAVEPRRSLVSGLVPKLAIVVAIVATLIAGSLWWQYRQFYLELANEDAMLLENLEAARATVRGIEDEVGAIENSRAADRAAIEGLRSDLEALPVELRALGRRVEALQGGQIEARDNWLREQAEYYLVLANTELRLGRRVDSAIAALELADDVLRELGDPALTDVRGAVASELQALRSIERPDIAGHAAELGGLIASVPELPMRAGAPENFGDEAPSLDDAEPGLGRLWESTKGAVTSIVRVERTEEPVGVVLTEAERRLARRQLALELQLARTALLDRRQETFRGSLAVADAMLDRDFARDAPAIVETRRLLADMMALELEPPLPDISDSLTLLRSSPGSD